jgi:hypothetical protein
MRSAQLALIVGGPIAILGLLGGLFRKLNRVIEMLERMRASLLSILRGVPMKRGGL